MGKPEEAVESKREEAPMRTGVLKPVVRNSIHAWRWATFIGVVLYFVSPWPSALDLGEQGSYPGWVLLFIGWIGVFRVLDGDLTAVGWLANPAFALGAIAVLVPKPGIALGAMIAAVVFSLGSFLLKEVPLDEAGNMGHIVGYQIGFWLWMAAIWLNLVSATASFLLQRSSTGDD